MMPDEIERALRHPGPREQGPGPAPLPADVAEARATLRQLGHGRWLRSMFGVAGGGLAVGVTAVATLLVVAALRSPTQAPLGAGSSGAGAASPPAASVGVLACAPDQLLATSEPWGGAAGSVGTTVTVTNTGDVACTVQGAPGARITDGSGAAVVKATGEWQWKTVSLMPPPLTLRPGDRAMTTIRWSNWCGAQPSEPLTASLQLVTGALEITPDASAPRVLVPPCNGADQDSSLTTIAFQTP